MCAAKLGSDGRYKSTPRDTVSSKGRNVGGAVFLSLNFEMNNNEKLVMVVYDIIQVRTFILYGYVD